MKNFLYTLFFLITTISVIEAQIFCPADVTVSCLSDLTPDECGMATVVSGNYHPSMIKYVDEDETNACNEGKVFRKFYIDIDFSNTYTENEPSCTQTITLEYSNLPLNIQFPPDREYSCIDNIPVESPTWLHNPCDLVGYTYNDEIFEFEEGACFKIVRTYSVINWCVYDENNQEGLYKGIQIIKIVDNLPPEIDNCDDQFFDAVENCEAAVTLINSASDSGDCPSGTLTWRVSIDLWGDGTEDLVYGPYEPFPFKLDPVANGTSVEVVLPENLGVSKNKIVWKVTDGCGNVRSCSSEFFVEDNKPPTPYCLNFTGTTINGEEHGVVAVPASFFSLDAIDNCSSKDNIQLSFSENVDDTVVELECGDAGFRPFRIYYTDEAGNQDFCEVFMLVFDNGSCFGKYAPSGKITRPNGTPIDGASAYLMEGEEIISQIESDAVGYFNFGEQALMESYEATVKKENADIENVDIDDFILMRSALLGLTSLDVYQRVAADVNNDFIFDINDLYEFRDILTGVSELEEKWSFIPKMKAMSSTMTNLDIESSIPYISYEGGFDFYGIQKGDLTGSGKETLISEDELGEINLEMEISMGSITIRCEKDIKIDAFQVDLNLESAEVVDEKRNESIVELNDGFRVVAVEFESYDEEYTSLAEMNADGASIDNLTSIIKDAKIYLQGSRVPSKIKWNIVDKRNNSDVLTEPTEIEVFPLPIQDRLVLEGVNITGVTLINVSGQVLSTNVSYQKDRVVLSNLEGIQRGIYFLKVSTTEDEQIIKVVK
ncbi:MAG: T9SS type A sorting domain-containing protein [Saprospiraceae bacterium]|nr:T9SS type A sorting domain-containing protein [Saprospiraceae bacterium]